jgi:HSF-type DNA-binding
MRDIAADQHSSHFTQRPPSNAHKSHIRDRRTSFRRNLLIPHPESCGTMSIDRAGTFDCVEKSGDSSTDSEESFQDTYERAPQPNYQSPHCLQYRDRSHFTPRGTLCHMDEQARFPTNLFRAIDRIQRDGLSSVISWQPHGRCFVIRKRKELQDLLPRYFKSITLYKSLQRQLYNYGFRRLKSSKDKGGYYHEFFLRDRPDLLCYVDRTRETGSGVRARPVYSEPDFYHLPRVTALQPACTTNGWSRENLASTAMDMSLSKACDEIELLDESEDIVCSAHQELTSWIEGDGEESGTYLNSYSGSLALSNSITDNQTLSGADEDTTSCVLLSDQALLAALEARCGYGPPVFPMFESLSLLPALRDPVAQAGQV